MEKMRKVAALLLCIAMVFALAACGGGQGETKDGEGEKPLPKAEEGSIPGIKKTLVVGTTSDINQLNPMLQNDQSNNNCFALSHFGLVSLNNVTILKDPALAESWEWKDDQHLIFHLVKNAKWSDGKPLTADDVVFTFERAASTDPEVSKISGTLHLVEKVEALDPYTVQITTPTYSNELVDTIMGKPLSIQSKAAWEDPNNKEPWLVANAQYKFGEWKEGEYVKYVRNENYWGDDPGMADEIIFKPMPEPAQRVIALQNGEIDVCIEPPASELKFLEDDPNITVHTQAGTRLFYMGFNCGRPPFDNQKLRQAVACCIDKDMIIQVVLGGRGKPQTTVLNRGCWSFLDNDEIEGYTYDLDRAKKLMEESGVKPGELKVKLFAPNTDPYKTIAPIIQADMKEIGIEVEIQTFDTATMKTECGAGNQDIFLWRWNMMTRLDETYRELFYTDYPTNYHHLSDPYIDKMADTILVEKDQDVRLEESHELQRYFAQLVPQVPLYVPDLVIAYNKDIQGTYLFGGGNHVWSHAYIPIK